MGKPHLTELRARAIASVEEGNTHREAARHFRISPRFVNNMVILKRTSGALAPARQGHLGGGKLTGQEEWVRRRLAENGGLTLDKTLLRKHAARTFDAITQALGDIYDLFSITECRNYFKAAGYEAE